MEFVPAGEIIEDVQVRSVTIAENPQIPAGEYTFVDMYCTDPSCDCRKTMISVLHNDTDVATIDFGWESDAYYEKWMGSRFPGMPKMSGASIARVDGITRDAILSLFNLLLDEKWLGVFKTHYGLVKAKLVEKPMAKNLNRRGNPAGTKKKNKRV